RAGRRRHPPRSAPPTRALTVRFAKWVEWREARRSPTLNRKAHVLAPSAADHSQDAGVVAGSARGRDEPKARGTGKGVSSGKGTGFIKPDDGGPDVFVHYSQVQNYGYQGLNEDDQVEYEVGSGATGPQATKVTVIR